MLYAVTASLYACRANDTTDIHIVRGSRYPTQPSLPFRTATLDHIQCGHVDCKPEERHVGVNLGLYSITFNNDATLDREALEAWLRDPGAVKFGSKMPDYALSDEEIDALIAYLYSLR